jgi:hypothetical protein
MSNDTDTRVVAFGSYFTGSLSVANNNTNVNITGYTPTFDTHGTWNASTGTYVVPVSGFWKVNAFHAFNAGAGTVSAAFVTRLYVNGVLTADMTRSDVIPASYNGAANVAASSKMFRLNAGDIITFRAFQNTGNTQTLGFFEVSMERSSGPSVIAATENVIAKYSTTAGQSITSTPATIVYATREIDSHGIVNTTNGNITIPISGKYLIGVYGSTASATWSSGGQFLWQIRKNGSFSSFINQIRAQATYTGILESVGPTYIDCLAGDVLNIQAQSSVATTLRTATGTNFFYLVRLGN